MVNPGEFGGGAALEAAFGGVLASLADVVKAAIERKDEFEPNLKKIDSKLKALEPVIDEIAEHNKNLRPPSPTQQAVHVSAAAVAIQVDDDKKTKDLKEKIVAGTQLVAELSEVSVLSCMNPSYTKKLVELDEALERLLQKLKLEGIRDVKENLIVRKQVKGQLDEVARDGKQIMRLALELFKQM